MDLLDQQLIRFLRIRPIKAEHDAECHGSAGHCTARVAVEAAAAEACAQAERLIAVHAEADLLVLLSDIDGLYTADPHRHPDAQLISIVPELTPEIMERLAGYTLVGFHVKGYPVTDELLAPFAEHKSMVNFGVEDGALTDACFPVFFAMPKLRYLLLDGNAAIHGSGLPALQGCKLDLLTLNRTGLDDAGLLQAASIPKLSHIQIDHTAVTYEGLLAIAGNNRIEPVAHMQFTKEQMEHFSQLQREKAKNPVQLDKQAVEECRRVLSAFFAEMTEWEQYMEQAGFEDAQAVPRLLAIWEKYVSEKPRPGYRPLGLSYSAQGTYKGEEFLDAEQITKNKLCIYTREKNTGFDRRFLMKRVGEGWMIDAVQERLNGWQRSEL